MRGKEPPPVPTLASAGMVVSVFEVPRGVVRMPSTLIWPPAGVSNSMVPRLPAVAGKVVDVTNAKWPRGRKG